ncbi:HTH-type transcriptional repressor SmtB [Clostridium tepidiprofundi DSM 19306]|uniref:HTH-type transcriptional repressor SmtB n=1 Tax=Clostridium tepidiprofundi DSM 19306 TaxID=1121338 RepID=A0A151B5U9_9CLOT|nr:metalloregulator ArsR/SmtB family transcription factor [Clostridium tepidiprofundi]KYH35295.1 HTH-type transcriptional repressor SmtB [Clostridium tepidiprofundi DSM 19306]
MEAKLKKLERMADLLKTLGHPVRLFIIICLMNKKCNVSEIQQQLSLPQSTVSQHLRILKAKKIIEGERSGIEIKYSLIDDSAKKIVEFLVDNYEEMATNKWY